MLSDFFKQNESKISDLEIDEVFDCVTIKFTHNSSVPNFVEWSLFNELKTISNRDKFELVLDIDGAETKISGCQQADLELIQNAYSEDDLDFDCCDVELKIWKKLENRILSIYFLEVFSDFLTRQNIFLFIENISKYFKENLVFEVFQTIQGFGSKNIKFVDSMSKIDVSFAEDKRRDKVFELFAENSSVQGINLKSIPEDFKLENPSQNAELNTLFNHACTALCLIFLSNVSDVTQKKQLNYKLSGYKTISRQNESVENFDGEINYLFKVYKWLYSDDNSADKIGLARNVITLHTDDMGRFKFDLEVWNAIQSNYQIYLKGNIQGYLDVKNKIGELVIESSAKLYSVAEEMASAFKNNLLIILTFIVTVVLVNGLKDNGVDKIFSTEYFLVVSIVSVLSIVWLIMAFIEAEKRFVSISENLKKALFANYKNILMESELEESIAPVVTDAKFYFKQQIKRLAMWWFVITVCFFLSFWGATKYLASVDEVGLFNETVKAEQLPKSTSVEKNIDGVRNGYQQATQGNNPKPVENE